MLRRLQSFAFRDSPYERPNQEWVCGHAADGAACSLGPDGRGQCRTVAECSPRFDAADQRYRCGRAPQHGGTCEEGPGPDGSCCRTITKCQPTRSLAARRRWTVRWVLALSIGVLLLGASGEFGASFVLSGDLTFQHGDVTDCGGCHGMDTHGPVEWLVGAFQPESGLGDSKRCLECHRLGEGALLAHSLPAESLTQNETPDNGGDPPLLLRMAKLAGPPPVADQPLACSRCHQEHNGRHFDLTAMSNQRCQACHADQFPSFADGHPKFEGYPYRRRPRIAFHHASHIGKHFKKNPEISAPTSCTGCHEPDSSGRAMLVKPFDQSCSACHLSQIQGEGRAGDKGYAMLGLPGFDVQTLYERGVSVGEWPRFADGKLTPFMSLLLASDPQHAEDLFILTGLDLMDLRNADDEQIAAVERVIWATKRLIYDLTVHGHDSFTERVSDALSVSVPARDVGPLMGTIPADAVLSAQRTWLPNLAREMAQRGSGDAVSPAPWWRDMMAAQQATPLPEPASNVDTDLDADLLDEDLLGGGDDLLGGGDDDLLGGDDDLLGSDDDLLGGGDDLLGGDDDLLGGGEGDLLGGEPASQPIADEPEVVLTPMKLEEWTRAGGWYRDEYMLLYRPTGHEDPFLRAWINLTAAVGPSPGASQALQIFAELTGRNAPGQCGKCHSVDATGDGELVVNWRPKLRTMETERYNK